jgi:hypothetical protein
VSTLYTVLAVVAVAPVALVVANSLWRGHRAAHRAKLAAAIVPQAPATPAQRHMMGFDIPGDEKVSLPARDWMAMRLALWRSKVAWDIVARSAAELVASAKHADGCPGKESESEPCLRECPDREMRLSALVIVGAAKQSTPSFHRPPDAPYFAPSREHFTDVLGELHAQKAELEMLRGPKRLSPDDFERMKSANQIANQLKEATS